MTKWSELNKKQKKKFGSKLAYQQAKQRGGYSPKNVTPRERKSFDAPKNNKKFGGMSKHLDKKYSELSKRQKERLRSDAFVVPYNKSKTGVTKQDWEAERVRQGFKNEPLIKGIRDKNLDKKYSQLTSKQKKRIKSAGGSKQTFKEAKAEKKAQDNLTQFLNRNRRNKQAENVDKIRNYDTTAGGYGSDKGKDHLSRSDLKHLKKMGFDKEKIIKYSEKKVAKGTGQGDAARRLLDRWKSKIAGKVNPDGSAGSTGTASDGSTGTASDGSTKTAPVSTGTQTEQIINENAGNYNNQQSNSILSTVQGDNNTVDVDQDNSIKNTGGGEYGTGDSAEDKAQGLLSQKVDEIIESTPATSSQTFNNQQDNDIASEVIGDNNFTQITQDNSIRNYGGDTRNFTYVGGKNPMKDMPMSTAEMAGFFDVDDSPAAQARRFDLTTDLMKQGKKSSDDFLSSAIASITAAEAKGLKGDEDDYQKKLRNLRRMAGVSRSRGDLGMLNIFGDRAKFPTVNYTPAIAPDPLKDPDFD